MKTGEALFEAELRAFFERLPQRAEAAAWLPRYSTVARFTTAEGDQAFVEVKDGRVRVTAKADRRPDLFFHAGREVYARIFRGEQTAGEAWWGGVLELGEPGQIVDPGATTYGWLGVLMRIAQQPR